jgi:manganese transport protein
MLDLVGRPGGPGLDDRLRPTADDPATLLAPAPRRGRWRSRLGTVTGLCGPAFVVSLAYVDPGNFATNMIGGARYGYLLLWVLVLANLLAMFVQYLSAKLGIATGQSLPELCREHCPRPVTWLLWAQAELVAMATDLAEFVGGALALNLLLGVPVLVAAVITGAVSLALLGISGRGRRRFEATVVGLLVIILIGFVYQAVSCGPFTGLASGLAPRLAGRDSLLMATGMVGATVMPHAIYLHSALSRGASQSAAGRRRAMRVSRTEIGVALGLAGLVNIAMLAVAAATFHARSTRPGNLSEVHAALGQLIGAPAAVAFAVALLAAGLASSSVGTYAGQIIMTGFLYRRIPLAVRRLLTMAPAIALLATGIDPTRALVLSQVALSLGLPFALVPLTVLTGRTRLMGDLANRRPTVVLGILVTVLVTVLNLLLLSQFLG